MSRDDLRAALRVAMHRDDTVRVQRDRSVLTVRLARLNQLAAIGPVHAVPAETAIRFGYPQVHEFGASLSSRRAAPNSDSIAAVVAGSEAGLDPVACIEHFLQGVARGLERAGLPLPFSEIVLVEGRETRRRTLRDVLDRLFDASTHPEGWNGNEDTWPLVYCPSADGAKVEPPFEKNLSYVNTLTAFVAMPFADSMRDVWHFGIEQPSREAGFQCERLDYEAYTGDVVDEIKQRIQRSHLVIVDLTHSNPNVFLELGYAWGKGRPTVLLRNAQQPGSTETAKVPFDVAGQHRIEYRSIKHLEDELLKLLRVLHPKLRAPRTE